MKRILLLSVLAFSFLCGISAQDEVYEVKSPDNRICMSLTKGEWDFALVYRITVDGGNVVDWSNVGYTHSTGNVCDVASILPLSRETAPVKEVWKPLWGKRKVVEDVYNTQTFQIAGASRDMPVFNLEVRVYNDGVAFRVIPLRGSIRNESPVYYEHTDFRFAGDYTAWYYNGERHNIGPEKLSDANGERLPIMIAKAAKMSVIPERIVNPTGEHLGAWRVLMVGRTPGDLVDSHLLELLNPEPEGDFSWVKPGVYLWDWRIDGAVWDGYHYGMNYDSWTRMIDFAASQGFQGLVLDANWYGPEFEKDSDPTKGDKARDVQRIIKYGKDKGVGVWLYLNDVAGTNYPIEETLAQYEQWGASGVKYGFMNGNPQEKNRKTQEITRLCAKHHLMVDYHDYPVHPFGQMRTWPNAVTREYCKAQLDGRQIFQPKTFVTSAFVNMVAGPIDQNNGFLELHQGRTTRKDNNQEVPTTVTGEIARTLITWSGATVIPDIPEYYQKYPTLLEFLSAEKQPWQESITLAGEIGEFIVMARQNKDGDWLIGAATNEDARTLDIPLSFLGKGKYTAAITTDAEDTHYRTNRETLNVSKPVKVNRKSSIRLDLAPGGGACVLIRK